MTRAALLDEAQRLLDQAPAGTVSAWPRAAAVLARQALEAALDELWRAREPAIIGAPIRAQLGCLWSEVDHALAADAAWTYHALSRATHHHPYELDPTREELASLVGAARRVGDALSTA